MLRKVGMFYLLLLLPYFVALEDSSNYESTKIYEYDAENFNYQIAEMDGNFIMFFVPWSRQCIEFHRIWAELAELVNTENSKFAIAQVDCTLYYNICNDHDVTGYPTLHYYHKKTFAPIEYKGTRDLPSLTLFLSGIFTLKSKGVNAEKDSMDVKIYSGMAYLNENNIEKFVSKGQHFIMFYASWCKASQELAPIWAELAVQYAHNEYIQIGKLNCLNNEITCKTFEIKQYPYLMWIVNGRIMGVTDANIIEELKYYVEKMLLTENHDPDKFMKKKKALPVARISEETFETFLEKELVFINYFAPWCAHCMQLNPLWLKLGERFLNESRVIIADVDCVQSKPICETEKINGLPTLILYKQKKIVNVEHGGRPLESLISLVTDHLQDTTTTSQEANEAKTSSEDTATKDEL